jgi:hypothetical protein
MRDRLLGLGQAARDRLAHAVMRDSRSPARTAS